MKNTLVLLISIAVAFSACKKDSNTKSINSDIEVEAIKQDSNIQIIAETILDFPCANYIIDYTIKQEQKRFDINFIKIPDISACLTAFGPARAFIDLGKLKADSYYIDFKLNGQVTPATLTVTSKNIDLTVNTGNVKLKLD